LSLLVYLELCQLPSSPIRVRLCRFILVQKFNLYVRNTSSLPSSGLVQLNLDKKSPLGTSRGTPLLNIFALDDVATTGKLPFTACANPSPRLCA
jgi:hypothetical protein